MPWTLRIALFAGALIVCVSAVGLWGTRDGEAGTRPPVLRVGVVPDVSDEALHKTFDRLVEYLRSRLKMPCELVIAADYQDLVDRIGRNEIDLAWLGALTFLRAHRHHGAVPLLMRDVDTRFTSVFIVRAEDHGLRLEDFKGRKLALGNEWSTSGHLMPRHFLEDLGLPIGTTFADAHHHGGHDVVALHVRDGKADIGVANGLHIERMFVEEVLSRDEVVILERTPPFVDYTWAVRSDLRRDVRHAITNALLRLDPMDPDQREILAAHDCAGYVPVGIDEFERVARIAEGYGLLERN